MFLALSVICLTMSGFNSKMDRLGFVMAANLIFILILLSPQFAKPLQLRQMVVVPQIAERYGEYGNDGTEGFLSKMLVLIPLDVMNRILPGNSALIASVLGFLMSIAWITIVSAGIRFDEYSIKWGIPSLIFICFLMVSWWAVTMLGADVGLTIGSNCHSHESFWH